MRKRIKRLGRKLLTPLAGKLGIIHPPAAMPSPTAVYNKDPLLKTFYNNLQAFGFNPLHIVDIGANHGTWTRETLKYFPDAFYTLLEPQYWLKTSIQELLDVNRKVTFHAVGAGAASGSFKFTIHDRDDSCSFNYTDEEAMANGFKQIEIPVVTLNELLAQSKWPPPDIIKIDAEGLDLEVLKGADNYFGSTEIFMVEAGVGNKTFNNSFLSIINFMDSNGYTLFDITDLNRPFQPPVLWLVELAFVKKGGLIDSQTIIQF